MKHYFSIFAIIVLIVLSCTRKSNEVDPSRPVFTGEAGEVKLIVLAPGHFHASLLQKSAMERVNESVQVYSAAKDAGLRQYLSSIESFNKRDTDPTRWQTTVYTGEDFLDKMV